MIILLRLTIIIFLLFCGVYVYSYSKLNDFSSFDKQTVNGSYAQLTDGQVFYKWFGEQNKEITILIHGISAPSIIWHETIYALTDSGQKVLVFDLYGRGYSDKPDAIYSEEFFNRQLHELLSHLKIEQKVNLVGFSLGGAIATSFTKHHKKKVNKLVLIAPTGLSDKNSFIVNVANVPVIGEWAAMVYLPWSVSRKIEAAINKGSIPEKLLVDLKWQYKYRGTLKAILSTARYFPHGTMEKTYRNVGEMDIPTMAIWGENDEKIPFIYSKKLNKIMPKLVFHKVSSIGHSLIYEHPEIVNRHLIDFLKN